MTALRRLALSAVALVACGGEDDGAGARDVGDRPDVLLVTLDTLRTDRVGAYGHEGGATPRLDALAARGTLFEQAYSPAPMTLPAHASLMTGLLPPEHGARVNGLHRLADDVPTLAERLSAEGFRTGAFVAAFVLDEQFGLARGFDVYDDDLTDAYEQVVSEQLSVYRPGEHVVDSALAWLDSLGDDPFFAWVHLYDAHFPWHPHGGGDDDAAGTYEGEVAYADAQLGRLLDDLRARGRLDDTLVVVVADHGEGLGDHGELEHAYLLDEEVLHVPLVIAGPGVAEGARVPSLVPTEDVQPTLLDLLGLADDDARTRSLVPALRGARIEHRASYAETDLPWTAFRWAPQRSLTTADWTYVRTPQLELYDRATDRAGYCNLAESRKDVLAELERALSALEAGFDVRESDVAEVGAEELEQLAALGYVAGVATDVPDHWRELADVKQRLAVKARAAELRRRVAEGAIDPRERLELAMRLVEQSPETPAFHDHVGAAHAELGDLAAAVPWYERVVELAPTDAGAHYALGDTLQLLGRTADARTHLEMALELDPGFAPAHVGMGNVFRDEGRVDLAAGAYSEALRLRPDYPEAFFNRAVTFLDRGLPERARADLERALVRRPGWPPAERMLAGIGARHGGATTEPAATGAPLHDLAGAPTSGDVPR